jgi:hypothetical protein
VDAHQTARLWNFQCYLDYRLALLAGPPTADDSWAATLLSRIEDIPHTRR